MNAPRKLRLTAPAKVNLYLAVGDRLPDGYHEVTTVLAALDLADDVTLSPASALSLTCEPDLGIPARDNLAYRAAEDLGAAVGRDPLAAIELRKRIPHGAGLGGGSSDAAAVLAGLAMWWGLAPTDPRVLDVARELGADVPFFLHGGTALFDGRGDRFVRSLPFVELHVALVTGDEAVPTGAAYAAFDRQLHAPTPDIETLARHLRAGDVRGVAGHLYNNMTESSAGLVGGVADAIAWMRGRSGVLGVQMAGSGSAVFGVCRDVETAALIAEDARSLGWWSAATRTVADGIRAEHGGGCS